MKFSARILGWLLALALIGYGLVYLVRLIWFQPSNVDYFFQRLMVERLGSDYELLTTIRPPFLENFAGYDADFSRLDTSVLAERKQWAESSSQTLAAYPYEELNAQDRLQIDIMQVWLEHEASRAANGRYFSPLEPALGTHLQLLTFLTTEHPITERNTAEDYLSRIKRWGQKFNEVERYFLQQEAMGLRLSTYQLEQSIAQVEALLALPSTQHPIYTTFASKASQTIAIDPTRMNEQLASEYLSQVSTLIERDVEPAYRSLLSLLKSRLEATPDLGGIAALPNAKNIYQSELARYTESEGNLAYWLAIAQDEFQMVAVELDSLLIQEGYAEGSLGSRYLALTQTALADSSWLGSSEYLKDIRAQLRRQRAMISGLVSELPFQKLNVRKYPQQLSPYVPSMSYSPATLDQSEEARLIINLAKLAEIPTWQTSSLLYAQAWPGTHLAHSMSAANPDIDAFQQIISFPAFRAGWESYSGYLIEQELLLLESQPLAHIGFLQYRLSHIAKAIIDASLQNGQMDIPAAQTFLATEVGLNESQSQSMINAVLARPGAAFSRLAGRKKILELRQRAKLALKGRFYVQEFHDILLKNGEVPLSVLEKLTETWIQQKLAS